MSSTVALPTRDLVAELMGPLLGRDVRVNEASKLAIDGSVPGVFAVYRDEGGDVGAVFVADVGLCAFAGAALSLIPAAIAKEAHAAGELPDNLLENFNEVLNVASRFLNGSGTKRQILREVVRVPQDAIPPDAQFLLTEPAHRQDWSLDVEGYGSGHLVILTV